MGRSRRAETRFWLVEHGGLGSEAPFPPAAQACFVPRHADRNKSATTPLRKGISSLGAPVGDAAFLAGQLDVLQPTHNFSGAGKLMIGSYDPLGIEFAVAIGHEHAQSHA